MKFLKWSLLSILLIIGFAILYLSIPTVEYKENPEGKAIPLTSDWNRDTIQFLKSNLNNAQHIDAFIAVYQGQEIFSYGETTKLINLHSARKPIMSLLIGIARDKGLLDLNETLGDLGISEYNAPLSEQESSATIRDLLMARSGVYLEADAEIKQSRENRPRRNQYKPGEFYFYNNFDFNALGTILKIKTGKSYEECLSEWLAKPLEMQEFYPENVVYGTPFSNSKTLHPAYKTWMSARDLASLTLH